MKTTVAGKPAAHPASSTKKSAARPGGKIHPVVIYPFRQPGDYADLGPLYQWVASLGAQGKKYARPITVMDRKTFFANEGDKRFLDFRHSSVAHHSKILDRWCVDTCQMWYTGLGAALEQGAEGDVYWLIPGDFNYGTPVGQEILGRLHDLPEICLELEQDMCVGEITTDHRNSKQLIDTYGTFALLYNWFPAEAREIRQYTERPRSEFFALGHRFLREALLRRWYPYEQTVVLLLHAVSARLRISRFSVGNISDLPEGRESLAAVVQQVERTEGVLQSLWRERHQSGPGWIEHYRALGIQSEQVRRTALILLQTLLA
ncbi:MAG: hypothetical protein ABSF38_18445 [Verrucomicrobiota bacterium]|jgi:hypothetical protein